MEKKISIKTLYLLFIISVGLIGLGIGSTYAVFTASLEINNPIAFNSTLSYDSNLIETVSVTIPAGNTISNKLNITNNTDNKLNYVTWYSNSGLDIQLGTSSGSTAGSLNAGATTSVTVDIRNNSSETITIILGISSSSESVVIGSGMSIIPSNELSQTVLQGAASYIYNLYMESEHTLVTNEVIDFNEKTTSVSYYYARDVNLMNDGYNTNGYKTNSESAGNIRYYGADPNNYVYFNCDDYSVQNDSTCEKWRIIGVFDGKVKIVRDEAIGKYSWDYNSDGTYDNDWRTATLNSLLNDGYYNNKDGVTYYNNSATASTINFANSNIGIKNVDTRKLISNHLWTLTKGARGIAIYPNYGYEYEMGNTTWSKDSPSWTGKIGLMYGTDYAYASDLSVCNMTLNTYSDANCTSTNWILPSYYSWLLPAHSTSQAWYINTTAGAVGKIYPGGAANKVFDVYPTLYLNKNVDILEGDGTSDSPYRLKVGEIEVPEEPTEVTAVEHIVNLYADNNPTEIIHYQDDGETEQARYYYSNMDEDNTWGLMNDALGATVTDTEALINGSKGNIRYYGKSPNNYVDIGDKEINSDDEEVTTLYRIIGVFKDVELSDGTSKDLIKVIRNEPIGEYAWDNKTNGIGSSLARTGSNDWSDARLMMLLNPGYDIYNESTPFEDAAGNTIYGYEGSLWWNSHEGYCYGGVGSREYKRCSFEHTGLSNISHDKIETVIWNLGATSDMYMYANDSYIKERGTNVYSNRPTEWEGEIALIYPSDYGYATDLSKCSEALDWYTYETSCFENNWINHIGNVYNGWTLTASSTNSSIVFYVWNEVADTEPKVSKKVYPTFYLDSELVIESGDGTIGSPYVLR